MDTRLMPGLRARGPDFALGSPSFGPEERMPVQHTADGQNLSPALSWGDLPEGVQSLALVFEDPDAPRREPFTHWLLANLDPLEVGRGLPQDVGPIRGAVRGRNSFGSLTYRGPDPPKGRGTHRYQFKLYALDRKLPLAEGFSKAQLLEAMRGHVLAVGWLATTYGRT